MRRVGRAMLLRRSGRPQTAPGVAPVGNVQRVGAVELDIGDMEHADVVVCEHCCILERIAARRIGDAPLDRAVVRRGDDRDVAGIANVLNACPERTRARRVRDEARAESYGRRFRAGRGGRVRLALAGQRSRLRDDPRARHDARDEPRVRARRAADRVGRALDRRALRALAVPRMERAYRRRGRERLASGLTALAEGRYTHAERDLGKASSHAALRGPALLALSQSAHERGSEERASEALDRIEGPAATAAPHCARIHDRQRAPRRCARVAEARRGERNTAAARAAPAVERLSVSGDTRAALDALPALARTQSLAPDDQIALDTRTYVAALAAVLDATSLNALWNVASRAQRRRLPQLIAAFAHRSAELGQVLAAMDEIESAERREWNDALALAYADLGPAQLPARTRKAESWLSVAPNSAALATALGRLCARQSLWGKSEQYLERALAIEESSLAWETLGDCYAGSDDAAMGESVLLRERAAHDARRADGAGRIARDARAGRYARARVRGAQ